MMNQTRKISTILACACLPFAFGGVSASEMVNTKPLFKDVVAGNPGYELVAPVFEEYLQVTETRDYPTKYKLRFRVYDAGSNTKLFATAVQSFTPPAAPCADNGENFLDWDFDVDFIGESDTHTGIVMTFYAECEEYNQGQWVGNSEVESAFIYMAETTSAGNKNNVWSKAWNKGLIGAHIVDWDDDQQDEVVVQLISEGNTSENLRTMILNKTDGAVEAKNDYTILTAIE